MVIDLKRLKDIMRERVVDRVDHTNLNEDVDFLRGVIPTAENLARAFWQQLAPAIPNGELYEVVLQETERNSVRYRGRGRDELRPRADGARRARPLADRACALESGDGR